MTPNTLEVLEYYNTTEGNLKPWLSRHPTNPSTLTFLDGRRSTHLRVLSADLTSSADLVIGCNDHAAPNAPGYLTSYAVDPSTGQLTYIDAVNTGGFPVPDYGVAAGNTYNTNLSHPIPSHPVLSLHLHPRTTDTD